MLIRNEKDGDQQSIYAINASAFDSPAEAKLVEALREQARPTLSLVAEENGEIVGHIMFSPATLSNYPELKVMGLAPMAVLPEYQRKGVGSALVQTGLERCRESGVAAVIVLGHPEYYPRFGFLPSTRFAIDSYYDVPEEMFMVVELKPGALDGKTGHASYHPAFDDL